MTANQGEEEPAKPITHNMFEGSTYGDVFQAGTVSGDVHFHRSANGWEDIPDPPHIVSTYHEERYMGLDQALDSFRVGELHVVSGFAAWDLVLLWMHRNKSRIVQPLLASASWSAQRMADSVEAQQPTHIVIRGVSEAGQVRPLLESTTGRRVIIVTEEPLPGLEGLPAARSHHIPDNDWGVAFPLAPTEDEYAGDISESAFGAGFMAAVIAVVVCLSASASTWTTVWWAAGTFVVIFCVTRIVKLIARRVSPPVGGSLFVTREGIVYRLSSGEENGVWWQDLAYVGVTTMKLRGDLSSMTEYDATTGSSATKRDVVLFWKTRAGWPVRHPLNVLTGDAGEAGLFGMCAIDTDVDYADFFTAKAQPIEVWKALERFALCNILPCGVPLHMYDGRVPEDAI